MRQKLNTMLGVSLRRHWVQVWLGVGVFLGIQYGRALFDLSQASGGMMNKFSVLARDQYWGFLVKQNGLMGLAYGVLSVMGAFLVQPVVVWLGRRSRWQGGFAVGLRAFVVVAVIHGYSMLRLSKTRPYFLHEGEFESWYYRLLEFPEVVKPAAFYVLFTVVPLLFVVMVCLWHLLRRGRVGWAIFGVLVCGFCVTYGVRSGAESLWFVESRDVPAAQVGKKPPNVMIIGSDSLRGDRLGVSGYRPQRSDGLAAAGVSPAIDRLAERSVYFERCYTSIASTLESGIQLMTSQYPQSHGVRQMYPNRQTVEAMKERTHPVAKSFAEKGYDTAVIGDWCAGYYEVAPLGFDRISASNFDNFKIYMSQAVVLAHFVVPLYFDNELGYRLFPQLQSFAQFVTPKVVTDRVTIRLEEAAKTQKPFFWHVFYSCNHLPYRSSEPYVSMFGDPSYQGRNKNGVDFDIDEFIGGTDLESKWKALPPGEIMQIRSLYDGCTRMFDDCVARILESLEQTGLADDTIVIVTADHGDDHYEPGVTLGHGLTFNGGGQANHVPLIIHVPGVAAKKIKEAVRLIDIAPTLAELVGLQASPTWQGQSFAGWLQGKVVPVARPLYGETGFPFIQFSVPGVVRPKLPPMDELTWIDEDYNYQFVLKPEYEAPLVAAKQRCLRTQDWKLVCTPTADGGRHFGLFHLKADPHGERNVSQERPEVLAAMKAALERWMDQRVETSIAEMFPKGEP